MNTAAYLVRFTTYREKVSEMSEEREGKHSGEERRHVSEYNLAFIKGRVAICFFHC